MVYSPNSDTLVPFLMSIGGGFFVGIILGYFTKKIIKILMFVAGGSAALLLYLQQQQIVSINLDKLEESSIFVFTTMLSSFNKANQIGDTASLGLPMAGGSFGWICNRFDERITKEVIRA